MLRILLVVLVSAGLMHAGNWSLSEDEDDQRFNWTCIHDRQEKLDGEIENQKRFTAIMHKVFGEITCDNLPLAQAVEQIEKASQTYCPIYLARLHLTYQGNSHKVRIANNLLAHLESLDDSAEMKRLCSRLRMELTDICLAHQESPDI